MSEVPVPHHLNCTESAALTCSGYLAPDEVLGAQRPRSDEHEILFVVIHQVYELWFKQLLHELASGAEYLRRTLFTPVFPDPCAVRSEL